MGKVIATGWMIVGKLDGKLRSDIVFSSENVVVGGCCSFGCLLMALSMLAIAVAVRVLFYGFG